MFERLQAADVRPLKSIVVASVIMFLLSLIEIWITISYGSRPALSSDELVDYIARTSTLRTGFLLADVGMLAGMLFFFGAVGELVRRRKPELEWLVRIGFSYLAIFVVLLLIGGSLNAAAGLLASEAVQSSTGVVTLWHAYVAIYGAPAAAYAAFGIILYSSLIISSKILPLWLGRLGYVAALLSLLVVPTLFHTIDSGSFMAPDGPLILLCGILPGGLWMLTIAVTIAVGLRRLRHKV